MIVGTAGHIDHGKSALIEALTGMQTDRLQAEQERGISIELGYAWLPVDEQCTVGFIDVPGHERLIHTMAAGATGMDFGLLVVAADDGVMPQTREHLSILSLLGLSRGAVVITKVDRVEAPRIAQVRAELATLVHATFLQNAPVFVVSAVRSQDEGIDHLRSYLQQQGKMGSQRSSTGLFRLAIDRAFILKGQGTIVTGTVYDGMLDLDVNTIDLRLMPSGRPLRVRSIHAQNRASKQAPAGQRCALNLTGIDKAAIARGDWVADARCLQASYRLDVELTLLADSVVLHTWTPVHLHLGAVNVIAHAVPLAAAELTPGQTGLVQLVVDKPVCALPGDRLIVRDAQARHTVGGGQVLDAMAPRRRRRRAARLEWLRTLATYLDDGDLSALLRQTPWGLDQLALQRLTRMDAQTILSRHRIENGAKLLWISPQATHESERILIDADTWKALQGHVLKTLQEFHERHPDEPGVYLARLHRMSQPTLSASLWNALATYLLEQELLVRNGPWVHLPGHVATLNEHDTILAQRLLPLIHEGGMDPPWVRDLAQHVSESEEAVRSVLRKLLRRGDVYQVVPDLFYHRQAISALASLMAEMAGQQGVTAAEFRDRINVGRKRTIQILEYFNRAGLSRRVRNRHVLRPDGMDFRQRLL